MHEGQTMHTDHLPCQVLTIRSPQIFPTVHQENTIQCPTNRGQDSYNGEGDHWAHIVFGGI